MRLIFVTSSLTAGGAERVLSIMANYWATRGHCIHFLTLDEIKGDFYTLDPKIHRHALGLLHGTNSPWGIIRKHFLRLLWIRQIIKNNRPDTVICFMDRMNVATLIATRWLSIPVIVSERTEPRFNRIGPLWSLLRRLTYPCAQALVLQTQSVKEWASNLFPQQHLFVIPNPLSRTVSDATISELPIKLPPHFIVAMGRMDRYKGFDLLINAFSKAISKDNNHDWELVIIGQGEEYSNLRTLSKDLGISKIVHLPGRIENPDLILHHAEIYVLSSLCEGFPNALLEAMRAGTAVISFDCLSGPAEIIRHGIDGLLIPAQDTNALEQAMIQLMQDEDLRKSLAQYAPEVTERFSIEKVMHQWEDVIQKVVSKKF